MKSLMRVLAFAALLFAGTTFAQSFGDLLAQANQSVSTFTAQGGATQANAEAAVRAVEAARAAATTAEQIAQANQLISQLNAAIQGAGLTVTTTATAAATGATAGTAIGWGTVALGAVGVAAAYQVYENQRSP